MFAFAVSILLAGLAGAWRLPWLQETDLDLSLWTQRLRSPTLDVFMRGFTFLGAGPALWAAAILAAVALWRGGRNREALAALLSLLAMPLNAGLKLIANRPRPENPVQVLTETFGTSFPSGHSMDSAAVYGTLAALVWSLTGRSAPTAALVAIPVGVGVSRVFLGAHWGYDVLAGWAGGALCVAAIVVWLRKGGGKVEDDSPSAKL